MATQRWILVLPLAAMISLLAGCAGSTANVQNPPPPPTSTVAISFQPAPPATISLNAATPLSAVVTNDPNNLGVDWSLTCSITGTASNPCGTLSRLHTDSASSTADCGANPTTCTTYTPPSTIPGNSAAVNIVAFATADHTHNQSAPITITGFGSTLKGTYVLQAEGIDGNFQPYQFAAVINLDGNGGISPLVQGQPAGEQTVNFVGSLVSKSDPITGGSYFIGSDGLGTITINTNDQDIGVTGVETFSFVALSASHALIAQGDFTETASGTMDLQTSTASPTGGYAFAVSGIDAITLSATSLGGVLNIDSANTISGTGSVADQNLAGTMTLKQGLSGTISNPDSFGAVTLDLSVPGFPSATTFEFTGYIVDSTHIKLIESDNSSGWTGGVAVGQGSATGTFVGDAAFSGTYVFGVTGQDVEGFEPGTYTSAGLFTADGSGGVASGFTDTFLQANFAQGGAGSQISGAFGGTYTVDTKATGRVRVNLNHFVPAPIPGYAPVLFFYLTGNGNPPLVLDGGDFSPAFNYPSVGMGTAYLRSATPRTFNGKYGFSLTQVNASGEADATGQMTANSTTGALSGTADINLDFSFTTGNIFNDLFTVPIPANGVSSGTILSANGTAIGVNYYVIDSSHGFIVETDLLTTSAVAFGYYAARTPVCTGCP